MDIDPVLNFLYGLLRDQSGVWVMSCGLGWVGLGWVEEGENTANL